jgi:hypothetical protein
MGERVSGESGAAPDLAESEAGTLSGGPEVERLAREVLRYLNRHPGASDTIEGIAQWWIAKQRLEDTLVHVQAAVDQLVERHLIEASQGAAGRTSYRLRREAIPPAVEDGQPGAEHPDQAASPSSGPTADVADPHTRAR